MSRTLLLFSSTDGHTRKIVARIAERFEHHGQALEVMPIDRVDDIDLAQFDAAIVGAPVRYGKHDRRIVAFLEHNATRLETMPNAFFSVNLIARTPAKRTAEGNSHVRKFLEQLKFKPAQVEVFAGRLDYPSYGWLDRFAIRMIMKMTGGPSEGTEVIDFTDWDQVADFGDRMAEHFATVGSR
ncbi:MAG: menaquinone-dependent protoporphyrinogen IX dehydrogenase [Wenzhouxiangellaceae bacterium]|nr:menaquinone-dependent protoporphyrinogen IX dehydrogenase [Wenzhouxiangellaceae bacterium]